MSHFPFKSVTFLALNGEQSHEAFFFLIEILFLDNLQCENIFFFPVYLCLKVKAKVTQSCLPLWNPHGPIRSMELSRLDTEVGSLSLLQGIFPTQGLNPSLPHYRQILYQLSHTGSPRILECMVYPFSRVSSQPRNLNWRLLQLEVDSLPTELSGKPTYV